MCFFYNQVGNRSGACPWCAGRLFGWETFWVGDSDGDLRHWAWFPGICHSLSRANWNWDKFFVRIVPVEKPIKFISPKMTSKPSKERMFHLARYIFTNTIVHMQKGSHGVNISRLNQLDRLLYAWNFNFDIISGNCQERFVYFCVSHKSKAVLKFMWQNQHLL